MSGLRMLQVLAGIVFPLAVAVNSRRVAAFHVRRFGMRAELEPSIRMVIVGVSMALAVIYALVVLGYLSPD